MEEQDKVWMMHGVTYVPGSNGKYMARVEAGGRQREAASQLWNAMSQRVDKRRCLYLHSLPVHAGPALVHTHTHVCEIMTLHESIYPNSEILECVLRGC